MIDINNCNEVFLKEANKRIASIEGLDLTDEEKTSRIDQINKKIIHTNEVVKDGLLATSILNFNDDTKRFTNLALLDHDIGRFKQMVLMGNYRDNELATSMGIKNHGILGRMVLNKVIKEQVPQDKIYHEPIKKIVNDHVDKMNSDEELNVLLLNLFENYSMEEILSSAHKNNALSAITQIVEDVDRLDIYHQILEGRWTPMKVEDDIDPKVFDMFYNGEYLNMAKLREQGLWNANVGELVRLGFIDQIKLLSVAKVIKEESIISRLKEVRQNPKAKDAFDYAEAKLDKMIESSTDGITVTKVKRI